MVAYGKDLDQLGTFLTDRKITQATTVRTEDIEAFKADLATKSYTPKSVSRKLNSIKTFFRYLRLNGILAYDPAEGVAHPPY